ncbi:hypothetical protein C8R46DRAFT_1208182 [Mycena filopes]|nr:hypothetical protein C8R46DRAFT_1208182 [Mycena filopes]
MTAVPRAPALEVDPPPARTARLVRAELRPRTTNGVTATAPISDAIVHHDSATVPLVGTGLLVGTDPPTDRVQATLTGRTRLPRPVLLKLVEEEADLGNAALAPHTTNPTRSCAGTRSIPAALDGTDALRDASGHPLFPATEAGEDDSDFGPLAGIKEPVNYAVREPERRSRAVEDARQGRNNRKVPDPLTLELAGVWATAGPVSSVDQAVNLMRWVYRGDNHATEFMRNIVARIGADTTAPRTIGEVTVLQNQNQAMAHYNATVYGARTPERVGLTLPIAVDTPVATPSAMDEDEPTLITVDASLIAVGGTLPGLTLPPSTIDDDNDDDTSSAEAAVFLGAARRVLPDATLVHLGEHSSTSDKMSRRGTTASISRAMRWYKNMPSGQWPFGMRDSSNAWPAPLSMESEPWALDVGAWFTLNALLPRRNIFSSLHRASSLKVVIRLLSVDGIFDHYAEKGGYVFDTLPLEHYPFDAVNVGFSHLICWLMQHGIAPHSAALAALQSYARSRRNRLENSSNPAETLFEMEWPYGPSDVGTNILRNEDCWANLRHGPVRNGTTTKYPSFPGAPAVPDVTMDNGEPFPQLPPPSPGEDAELQNESHA